MLACTGIACDKESTSKYTQRCLQIIEERSERLVLNADSLYCIVLTVSGYLM